MSLGNGNPKEGNKGSNWKFEYSLLTGIQEIANNTGGGSGGLLATAANQVIEQGILNNILAGVLAGQAYTQALVTDNGGVGCPANCPVYVEIRIWNPGTQTFGPPIYYNASGGVVVPVGPVTFVNDAFTLQSILVQDTAINANTLAISNKLPTTLGQKTMAASLAVTIASDQSPLPVTLSGGALDFGASAAAERVAALLGNTTGIASFGSGTTSAQTLRVVLPTDQTSIPITQASTVRTPSLISASGVGTVAAGARSVSVFNSGLAAGVWLGSSIPSGVQLSYDAGGQGDTLSAFAYDGTGTTLIITSVV